MLKAFCKCVVCTCALLIANVYFCFSRLKKSPSKMLADSDDDDDDDDFSTDGDSLCEVPSGNNFSKGDDTKV